MGYIGGRLHEVKAWGGESESLPPGEYAFQIKEVVQGTSSNKGTPQLEVSCVVLNQGEMFGRGFKSWYMLKMDNETSRKRLRSLTDATGCPLDAQGGFDDQALVGRTFVADVVAEEYEGKADPATGKKEMKTRTKAQNERPLQQGGAAAAVSPQPQAVAVQPVGVPAQAAPVAFPQPVQMGAPRGVPQGLTPTS